MFSDLDSIHWKGIGYHVYSRHEEIPQAIRDLLSKSDSIRAQARTFLLVEGQDFGDIYDTTVIQVLRDAVLRLPGLLVPGNRTG